MRSVGIFAALMVTGVLIVLIYIWSGESIVALIMAILTLFLVLGIAEWKPWQVDSQVDSQQDRPGRTGDDRPVWRSRLDVTWDERGVSGVELGASTRRFWSWPEIDDIGWDWCPDGRSDGETRIGLHLYVPDRGDPEQPAARARFGPAQDPDDVVQELRSVWLRAKVARSPLQALTAEERTRQLGRQLGRPDVDLAQDLTQPVGSPELLYQEIRRALLSAGELVRIEADADFATVLDGFDRLLEANDLHPLTGAEAQELERVSRNHDSGQSSQLASLHWTLDAAAERRDRRMAFIDQGGEDHLVGLVAIDVADHWDGQTVGSGSARVMLDLPG